VGLRPKSRREALLYELCARYGYCNDLDPDSLQAAASVEVVVRSVLEAEGLDPVTCTPEVQAQLARTVDDWLFDPHGCGVRSGLPQ
jgi:hypothetical protein